MNYYIKAEIAFCQRFLLKKITHYSKIKNFNEINKFENEKN